MLEDPEAAGGLAMRARQEVVDNWDMATISAKLAQSYRSAIAAKRSGPTFRG